MSLLICVLGCNELHSCFGTEFTTVRKGPHTFMDPVDSSSLEPLVVSNPGSNEGRQTQDVPDPDPIHKHSPPQQPRVLPSAGAFTVQCANCFKWRIISKKEKYEEIREHILQRPFFCETAREWRPDISCDDATDISQDGTRIWAVDKPSIPKTPPGWQRLLQIRGAGSSRFADVYYQPPTGKRLRSMVDVEKYLRNHPEHMVQGVTLSQFSFQVPKPCVANPGDLALMKKARKNPTNPVVL